jgi:hypothetical protein
MAAGGTPPGAQAVGSMVICMAVNVRAFVADGKGDWSQKTTGEMKMVKTGVSAGGWF